MKYSMSPRARLVVSAVAIASLMGTAGLAQQGRQGGAAAAQGRQGGAGAGGGRQGAPGRQGGQNFDNVEVHSLHVQGNVWMLNGGFVNAAIQVGDDGVLVVDTMVEPLADKMLAEIRKIAGDKPIRYVINTHVHPDHTGGNEKIAKAGSSIVGGNFAGQVGQAAADSAEIFAHENVQARMSQPGPGEPMPPFAAWPTDTYIEPQKDLYFNGEGIELLHQPNAHTDGDTMVYFRKSDVLVTGDVYINTTFPVVNLQQGGSLNGILKALNNIIRITIPKEKQEGGTYVIPGHGHLVDEADVVEYRDMNTIIRDRIQDAIKRGRTLEQTKAEHLVRDYDGRYGATQGFWTTDQFVEAAYKSLSQPQAVTRSN
jgi:glyoxylase-like metal-dependent hydrolase (beta-lactamase superfamily II)